MQGNSFITAIFSLWILDIIWKVWKRKMWSRCEIQKSMKLRAKSADCVVNLHLQYWLGILWMEQQYWLGSLRAEEPILPDVWNQSTVCHMDDTPHTVFNVGFNGHTNQLEYGKLHPRLQPCASVNQYMENWLRKQPVCDWRRTLTSMTPYHARITIKYSRHLNGLPCIDSGYDGVSN